MHDIERAHLLTDEERAFSMPERHLVMRYGDFKEYDTVPLLLRNFIGGHTRQCQCVCFVTNH
jgi:hypothetical protein